MIEEPDFPENRDGKKDDDSDTTGKHQLVHGAHACSQ